MAGFDGRLPITPSTEIPQFVANMIANGEVTTEFIPVESEHTVCGTYDIGLQSLSGAMERGHDMVYVCYDNGAYMNTGVQRSSATPMYADTTTTPSGKVSDGKPQARKDLVAIIAAHNIPYVAQTTFIGNMRHRKLLNFVNWRWRHATGRCLRSWRANGFKATNRKISCR